MRRKVTIIGIIIILFLLIIDAAIQIEHCLNFERQKENDNNKWKSIENRIIIIEEKMCV